VKISKEEVQYWRKKRTVKLLERKNMDPNKKTKNSTTKMQQQQATTADDCRGVGGGVVGEGSAPSS